MFARLMGLSTISPRDVYELLDHGGVTAIDVNSRQSWITARVPGALNLDPVAYTEGDLPADKSTALVFYYSNPLCRKAPNAARRATAMGYTHVQVMSAGISGWLSADLPTQTGG